MRAKALIPLSGLLVGLAIGARGSRPAGSDDTAALAARLRDLYAAPGGPGERWGYRARTVTLADGSQVPREQAYRDDPRFVDAAAALLGSTAGDDAPLGAWLLGTAPAPQAKPAERALVRALDHRDPLAVLEAARGLGELGGPDALEPLRSVASKADREAVRAAAAWAAERVAARSHQAAGTRAGPRLAPGFRRGVCWWYEGQDHDEGRASFARLRALGVDWISIHTWEPLQLDAHRPEFAAASSRWTVAHLPALVARAHEAGLRVMYKPHLEMAHPRPAAADLAALRGPDGPARREVVTRLEAERHARGWHGAIEMRDEAGWRAWFDHYDAYLLAHARRAQEAGADVFCVGRELDRTVLRREADWRRLIARVRTVYAGPLTYSAHHDTAADLGFWDALDYVGVAAYFPLSQDEDPSLAALEAGWEPALARLEATARKTGRPVLFTEVGYPAVRGAAREPWSETRGPADPWLQARCYEAALRSASRRPWLQGTFFWLWEGVAAPPFRDRSFTLQGKPAAFVMSAYYR